MLILSIITFGCRKATPTHVSFYYWRSNFILSSQEKECFKNNGCKSIYLKYFDVIKEDGIVKPVSIIQFTQKTDLKIIPIVFIRNDVFANTNKQQVDTLVSNVQKLITQINSKNNVSFNTIQFDCDWTESTQLLYFYFLKQFGQKTNPKKIGATIRLHQIKYKFKTGIPPVNFGALMFYNMGKIAWDTLNSIYSNEITEKYISYLENYPLQLTIALPIFGCLN